MKKLLIIAIAIIGIVFAELSSSEIAIIENWETSH
jgi:hypothetical protein